MRLPIAIYPIGHRPYRLRARRATTASPACSAACYVVGDAVGNPVLARAGRPVRPAPAAAAGVLPCTLASVSPLARAAQLWTRRLDAAAAGGRDGLHATPSGRWSGRAGRTCWRGRPELATAYSVESVLDEVIFVLGPLIATVLATHADPVLVLYLSAALDRRPARCGWRRSAATEPPVHPPDGRAARSALRYRGHAADHRVRGRDGRDLRQRRGHDGRVLRPARSARRAAGWCSPLRASAAGRRVAVRRRGTGTRTCCDRFRLQALVFGVLPLLFLAATNVPCWPSAPWWSGWASRRP